jgi:hypothetical protein
MLAEAILRIIAALLEAHVEVLRKATPEQVQAIITRHEERLARYERLRDKFLPDTE